jgi:hypothetical protein
MRTGTTVEARGEFGSEVVRYARRRIGELPQLEYRHVAWPRVRLTRPAVSSAVTAQATVQANGRLVRAQVVSHAPGEAVDLLAVRLHRRLSRVLRLAPPAEGEESPTEFLPPGRAPRGVGLDQLSRRKPVRPARLTVDEAALEMYLRDYAFHLFTESGSGQDSVLYRAGDGYRLAAPRPQPRRDLARFSLPLVVDAQAAPVQLLRQAVERLAEGTAPFRLFVDRETQCPGVVYRRYDGRFGLLSPVVDTPPPLPTTILQLRRALL